MKTNVNTALLFLLSAILLYWIAGNISGIAKLGDKIDTAAKAPRTARVVSDIRLSESETFRVIRVPNPMVDQPEFDMSCVIYSDREARDSSIACLKGLGGGSP